MGGTPGSGVADAVRGNWVDRLAPPAARPFLRLSRLDRPIGSWLLFLPCLWGLGLAVIETGTWGLRDLWTALGCGIGAVLMRGAGCTWNDVADRRIDAEVARTRSRPLPAGEVSVRGALLWLALQALAALAVLLTFYPAAILWGLLSLVPVLAYPFAKRVTWWPQAVLGVAFNWGVLVAYAAHANTVSPAAFALWASGVAWTLFYDTIYAHQDREDDAMIGVRSTARLFGEATPRWLRRFLVATVSLMALAIILAATGERPGIGDAGWVAGADRRASVLALVLALLGPWAMGWHLAWQLRRFDPGDQGGLLRLFRSNRDAGALPALALAAAALA